MIEFGVASGAGLLELERICEYVEKDYDIELHVYGFDTGTGLPRSDDYRDAPWKWGEGWYEMDVDKLNRQLKRAKLVIGNV